MVRYTRSTATTSRRPWSWWRPSTPIPAVPARSRPTSRWPTELASHEIANLDDRKDRVGLPEEMIVGQVVCATVLTTLRRLAEEHHSHERFGEDRRD